MHIAYCVTECSWSVSVSPSVQHTLEKYALFFMYDPNWESTEYVCSAGKHDSIKHQTEWSLGDKPGAELTSQSLLLASKLA